MIFETDDGYFCYTTSHDVSDRTITCILIGIAATLLVILGFMGGNPATDDLYKNGSSDGRYHTCGYVTEDGVTEYLDTYAERCGDQTYAGDNP